MLSGIVGGLLSFELQLLSELSDIYEKKGKIYRNTHYSQRNIRELITFLSNAGFPDKAIDFHCPVGKYFHDFSVGLNPDITIVEPISLEAIAFFRVFDNLDDYKAERSDNEQFYGDFYHYQKRTKQNSILYDIPYYLVWKHNGKLAFIDIKNTYSTNIEDIDEEMYLSEPFSYSLLINNAEHRRRREQKLDAKKILDLWKYAFSIFVPIVCCIILVLDAKGLFTLSIERLIIIGIAFCSLLVPYLTQVSIKDISLDFHKKEKEDEEA